MGALTNFAATFYAVDVPQNAGQKQSPHHGGHTGRGGRDKQNLCVFCVLRGESYCFGKPRSVSKWNELQFQT